MYELLWDYFVPYDFVSGFDLFYKVCGHIVQGHVPPLVSRSFSTSRLLVFEKHLGSIRPIAIGEMTYRLVVRILSI